MKLKPLGLVDDRIPCPKCGKRDTNLVDQINATVQRWQCDNCSLEWAVITNAGRSVKLTDSQRVALDIANTASKDSEGKGYTFSVYGSNSNRIIRNHPTWNLNTYYIYQGTAKVLLKFGLLETSAYESQYRITEAGKAVLRKVNHG